MDSEFKKFIKVWLLASVALTYCHYIASRIPKGITRLISILPIIFLLTILPLYLHSFYLCAYTAMFLSFMANFNLLLFSFDQRSLSSPPPKLSHFISLACLHIIPKNNNIKKPHEPSSSNQESTQEPPLRVKNSPQEPPTRRVKNSLRVKNSKNPSQEPSLDQEATQEQLVKDNNNSKNPPQEPPSRRAKNPSQEPLTRVPRAVVCAIKAAFLVLLHHKYYSYKQCLHPYVVSGLLCAFVYLQLEIIYALCGFLARTFLRIEKEPPFNEPYLASSDLAARLLGPPVEPMIRSKLYGLSPISYVLVLVHKRPELRGIIVIMFPLLLYVAESIE